MVMIILDPLPHIPQPRDLWPIILQLGISDQAQAAQQRRRRRRNIHVVAGAHEVEQAEPVAIDLIRRRAHDAMDRRLQVPLAPELQRVADVADDAAVDRRDVLPRAIEGLNLQARDVLAPQQRQRAEVRVCARPGVLDQRILLFGTWVIEHVAQMVFGFGLVGVPRGEVVGGQLEDQGEEGEDLGGDGEGALGG